MTNKVKDKTARNQNTILKRQVKTLEETSLGGLTATVNSLSSSLTSALNRITALENKLSNYKSHTHNYEDNNGTTDTTRITGGITQ